MTMDDMILDARGLFCPMPVLRARKALRALGPGRVLAVDATDPAADADLRAFCRAAGYRFLEATPLEEGATRYRIESGAG